jgi:integrase
MPKTRLSAIAIEKLAPPQSGRIEVHDSEVPGLVLRVSSSGVKSFSLTYRFRGVLRRLTLGQWSPSGLSLKEARERAREARGAIQRGSDPVEERKEEERERATTAFSVLVNDFVEKWCKPRQRTWKKTEAILKRLAVSEFGDRPVRDITRRDIANLLDRVASGTPYQSNILRAWLSKFWNWCLEAEYAEVNPVAGVSPRIKPQARSRVLTNAEVVALWKAAQKVGGAFGDATRSRSCAGTS